MIALSSQNQPKIIFKFFNNQKYLLRFFYWMLSFFLTIRGHICPMIPINDNWVLNNHDHQISLHCSNHHLKHRNIGQVRIHRMSNICSLSMENTHTNVEFWVIQKTSKQSLISIFFYIGRGPHPLPYPPPSRYFVPRSRASPLLTQTQPPPTIS